MGSHLCLPQGPGAKHAGAVHEIVVTPSASVEKPKRSFVTLEDSAALKSDLEKLLKDLGTGTATRAQKAEIAELKEMVKKMSVLKTSRDSKSAIELATLRKEVLIGETIKTIETAEQAYLAFLMDCTGSMASQISAVKEHISAIVDHYGKTHRLGSLQIAFVGYRDFGDANRFEMMPFTNDVKQFKAFVAKIEAAGGDDAAEDVAGGLSKANQLNWNAAGKGATKILIHIADAPAHGRDYHEDSVGDSHASSATDPIEPLRKLQQQGVQYIFGKINSSTDKMIRRFTELIGGRYIQEKPFDDASLFLTTLTAVVSQSVMRTVAAARDSLTFTRKRPAIRRASRASSDALSGIEEEEDADATATIAEPAAVVADLDDFEDQLWFTLSGKKVQIFTNTPLKHVSDLPSGEPAGFVPAMFNMLTWEPNPVALAEPGSESGTLRVQQAPFASGACRWAFRGQLETESGGAKTMILKRFKGPQGHTMPRYRDQIEVSNIAAFLADQFSRSDKRPAHCKSVRFLKAHVVKLVDPYEIGAYYTCEDPLPPDATFTKFSDNATHWDETKVSGSDLETLLRFAKYTCQATKGYLMVTDLQGVMTEDACILTDPAIHCRDINRFGDTNLGPKLLKGSLQVIDDRLAMLGAKW
jgi:hypothetical protein